MKYQKQKQPTWCGVACLSTIYNYLDVHFGQEQLYKYMKQIDAVNYDGVNKGNVKTWGLLKHVLDKTQLSACAISVSSEVDFFNFITSENIQAIILHKAKIYPAAHFSIFDKIENGIIYVFDPLIDKIRRIGLYEIHDLWKTDPKFDIPNKTAILITNNKTFDYQHIASCCGFTFNAMRIPPNLAELTLCPYCDKWDRIK